MIGKPRNYAQWRRERLQDAWLEEYARKLRIVGRALDLGMNPGAALALDALERAYQ